MEFIICVSDLWMPKQWQMKCKESKWKKCFIKNPLIMAQKNFAWLLVPPLYDNHRLYYNKYKFFLNKTCLHKCYFPDQGFLSLKNIDLFQYKHKKSYLLQIISTNVILMSQIWHGQGIYLSWLRRYHQKWCQPGDQTKDHSCQQMLLWSQWAIE